ncbi:restriction endonuclease subunit S [Helicobacter sp. 23-1046]
MQTNSKKSPSLAEGARGWVDSIPKSWQIKTLGDIFLIERGGSPRPIKQFLTNDENGINWIKIGDTKNVSKYIYSTAEKIKPDGKKHSRFVEIGDLILSNSMSFGRPYIMKTTGCIHDGWVVFRNIKKLIDEEYAYYALISNQIYAEFSKLATGSTVKNLSIDRVKQVAIPLPPLQTQKQIVEILEKHFSSADKTSAFIDSALKNAKQLKSSLLKSAFMGKLI